MHAFLPFPRQVPKRPNGSATDGPESLDLGRIALVGLECDGAHGSRKPAGETYDKLGAFTSTSTYFLVSINRAEGNGKKGIYTCRLVAALAVVGGKWKFPHSMALPGGPRRFGRLRRFAVGISEKMLIQELKEMDSLQKLPELFLLNHRAVQSAYKLFTTDSYRGVHP